MVCAICRKEIEEADEIERVDEKCVHADCYFYEFGEEIAKNPIFNPKRSN